MKSICWDCNFYWFGYIDLNFVTRSFEMQIHNDNIPHLCQFCVCTFDSLMIPWAVSLLNLRYIFWDLFMCSCLSCKILAPILLKTNLWGIKKFSLGKIVYLISILLEEPFLSSKLQQQLQQFVADCTLLVVQLGNWFIMPAEACHKHDNKSLLGVNRGKIQYCNWRLWINSIRECVHAVSWRQDRLL